MFDSNPEDAPVEPGNVGDDDQNLDPTELDDEQIDDLLEAAQAALEEQLALA